MKLKYIVLILYLLVSLPLFLYLKLEITVWISFFVNFGLITIISYYHLNIEKTFSPFLTSYIVFVFLFFLVAPMIQIDTITVTNPNFPNAFPYRKYDVIYANCLIFIFNFMFFAFYIYYKKHFFKKKNIIEYTSKPYSTPILIITLLLVCIFIGYLNYDFIIDEFQRSTYSKSGESVSSLLIRKKVLFLLPLGSIVIVHTYLKNQKRITSNFIFVFFILIILVVILILFKNPLIEKRNALGPIYITLIFIFTPKLINNNSKFFLFIFMSMVLLFPLVSAFTHVDATFQELVSNPKLIVDSFVKTGGIANAFSTLHYDAFANVLATVDYVSVNGFSYGFQLLSAFLFFVPRSFWTSKPDSTGEMIGNYLIDDYNFKYSNLSNPILSEGYLNFGIIGLIIMAIFLAYFIGKFLYWLNSGDKLKAVIAFYFSVHLIFLLRGDFTNGFSYFIGTFAGVMLIPRLIDKFISFSLRKSSND